MIEETVFTEITLIDVVKEKYGIDVTKIQKLDRGSANLYSLNELILSLYLFIFSSNSLIASL